MKRKSGESSTGAPREDTSGTNILPDGWVEETHSSSGKAYYFNELMNETAWEEHICETGPPKLDTQPCNQLEAGKKNQSQNIQHF